MTTTTPSPETAPASQTPPASQPAPAAGTAASAEPSPPLWAERVGAKTYIGRNDRGAEVRVGHHTDEGVFSPGELLKVALAACSGMSAERAIQRRLGEDTAIKVSVRSVPGPGQNRYAELLTDVLVPLDGLNDEDRDRFVEVALKAIAAGCTVGRTLEANAHLRTTITDAG